MIVVEIKTLPGLDAGGFDSPLRHLTSIQEIDGARMFCTCGNPDPLNEDHTPTCAMMELIELLGYLPE